MVGQVTAADVAELCRSQLCVGLDPKMLLLNGPVAEAETIVMKMINNCLLMIIILMINVLFF